MNRTKILQWVGAWLGASPIGALARRLRKGRLANGVVIGSGLLTIALVISAAVRFLRKSNAKSTTMPLQESENGDQFLNESPPPPEPHSIIIDQHLTLERRDDRWILRLENVWRIQFLEIALTLPQGWRNRLGAFPARAFNLRASFSLLSRPEILGWVLFALSLGVYAFTRFMALEQFPIFFFADEAIQSVLASDLLQRGLRDYQDHLLPLFFNTYGFFNPLISVYFQAIGIALFGKSILVTRVVSAFLTLLGSGAVGLILKWVFKARYWWVGTLFLAATPAWFLHSRTAFETATMVSLYACFLLCYLLYRCRSPRFIYPTLLLAAATFYSYGNGQLVIGITGILLFFSDLRYHLKNWRMALPVAALLILLAAPYFQFRADHPSEVAYHLRTLSTYWLRNISVEQKITEFLSTYAYGISPQYWFIPNTQDLARHRMKDYGDIMLWTLPLFLVGVGVCFWRIKSAAHRAVIIAALAAPIGGAITAIAITRVLAFVIPASLFSALGLEFLLQRLRRPAWQRVAPAVVFIVLSFASLTMLRDALDNGLLWQRDYGLYGMQWGAKQLFEIIPQYLKQSPDTRVYLTPTWANGTDVFRDFFMKGEPRLQILNVEALIGEMRSLEPNAVFVMTPSEYRLAQTSKKFKTIQIDHTLLYPDGSDGFYFSRLAYVDNVSEIFAAEKEARRKPVTEQFQLNGETITFTHSLFDAGRPPDLFDQDTFTLTRVMEANPAMLEFVFPTPRRITGLAADFGTMNFALTVSLYTAGDVKPITHTQTYRNQLRDPHVEMQFENAPPTVTRIRIEVEMLDAGGPVKIHIREIRFQ